MTINEYGKNEQHYVGLLVTSDLFGFDHFCNIYKLRLLMKLDKVKIACEWAYQTKLPERCFVAPYHNYNYLIFSSSKFHLVVVMS